jgi:hypothetical protein
MQTSDRLTQLRHQYLELTNQTLPQLAATRRFPVRFNHCFQRIILDNLFGRCWYDVLDRRQGPAYLQLDQTQLEQAIGLARHIMTEPNSYLEQLNRKSLGWRGKSGR